MEEKEFSYINMVPFIDVMLVLLTIILMTSTFVVSGLIPVELPKVPGKYENAMRTKIIEIDRAGSIYYQGAALIFSVLKKNSMIYQKIPFSYQGRQGVALQNFVEVLDIVKTMGFRRVSLQQRNGDDEGTFHCAFPVAFISCRCGQSILVH